MSNHDRAQVYKRSVREKYTGKMGLCVPSSDVWWGDLGDVHGGDDEATAHTQTLHKDTTPTIAPSQAHHIK